MSQLKRLREQAGLTQEQLAAKTGLRQQYISELETGRIRKPSLEAGIVLAEALGCDPRELRATETDAPTAAGAAA